MSKPVSFAEHIADQLDHIRVQHEYIKSKAVELEAALKLIHPEYSVSILNNRAVTLADAGLLVLFKDKALAIDPELIKHNDIYISDAMMEILIDRPVVREDSPYFNVVLKRLVDLGISKLAVPSTIHAMSKDELVERRDLLVEIYAKMQTSLKDAMTLIRNELRNYFRESLIKLVDKADCFPIPKYDSLAEIDKRINELTEQSKCCNKR